MHMLKRCMPGKGKVGERAHARAAVAWLRHPDQPCIRAGLMPDFMYRQCRYHEALLTSGMSPGIGAPSNM